MKNLISGYILAFFTVMMWSLNLIYSKYLAGAVTPAEISFYRWFFAFIVMLPFCYKNFKAEFKAILSQWKLLILMAATGTGGLNLLVYYAPAVPVYEGCPAHQRIWRYFKRRSDQSVPERRRDNRRHGFYQHHGRAQGAPLSTRLSTDGRGVLLH